MLDVSGSCRYICGELDSAISGIDRIEWGCGMKKVHRKVYGPSGRKHGSEDRQLKKYIGKRISEDDHQLLTRYAASLNVDVAALLAPHVDSLLDKARQHHHESALAPAGS